MKTIFNLVAGCILLMAIPCRSQNQPVAVNDTAWCSTYDTLSVNVLSNDYDPDGDSLEIFSANIQMHTSWGNVVINDSNLVVAFNKQAGGWVGIRYRIRKINNPTLTNIAFLFLRITNPCCDSLSINNVNALYSSDGSHFHYYAWATGHYYIPKNSLKSTVFSATSWAGGRDPSGNIHLTYKYDPSRPEMWSGPVSNPLLYNNQFDKEWYRIWKLRSSDIDYHKAHVYDPGYVPVPAIATWPGNGDTTLGQSARLAPFHDLNSNGQYEPLAGDWPVIKGDECLFFIQNDDRLPHNASNARKLGLEVRSMAYAFDCWSDSALVTATFLHYDLVNRSDTVYDSTFYGLFVDTDLGYAWDDYIGCDVARGAYYAYNGLKIDGNGDPDHYGAFPPIQAVVILGGPVLPPDNTDNPAYDPVSHSNCGIAVNGLNFGDSIIDNERYGMTGLMYGNTGNMSNPLQYYNYLKQVFADGVHMQYGGNGHPNTGATGPPCSFIFPDLSDPCDWGTNGISPPGYITGYGGAGIPWNETSIGNVPGDRRGLVITGPFTFYPGDIQPIDIAFVFARNYQDSGILAAKPILDRYIDSIRMYFKRGYTPCGGSFTTIAERPKDQEMFLYPNPASTVLNLRLSSSSDLMEYSICELTGTLVIKGRLNGGMTTVLDVSGLRNGIYLLSAKDRYRIITRKFVVLH